MDLPDNYRMCTITAGEYTFLSSAYGTFSKVDHKLDHKIVLVK